MKAISNKSLPLYMKIVALLLPIVLILASGSCRERSTIQGDSNANWQESGKKWQEELLTYAIENLNQLEKFQTQEHFFHIFKQIFVLQAGLTGEGEKKSETKINSLTAAWPDTEIHRQILDRLNQWIRSQPPPGDWKSDPLVETLPESLANLPLVKSLSDLEFTAFDVYALQEAVLLRDAVLWARGDAQDDITKAKNLFDWIVRNIQLEPDSKDRLPLFPWESLMFGRGTVKERAWVFILLARQEGLDAVLLSVADPPENSSSAKDAGSFRPWCVAVLIDKNAYLFDPLLGMPIPAKDGIRRDDKGQLEFIPATLAEVMDDESLLKRLNIDSEKTYPIKQTDLQNIVALVEASPTYLSRRMKLIESRLAGKNKMVLTTSAKEQSDRWKTVSGVGKAQLWLMPYETIALRSHLAPADIAGQLFEFLRFYAIPDAPLAKGRILNIKGQFVGQAGATKYYQSARPSASELEYLSGLPSIEDLDRAKQDLSKLKSDLTKASNDPSVRAPASLQRRKQDVDEKMADIDLATMAKRLEAEYANALIGMPQFQSVEEKERAKAAFQQQALQILLTHILFGKQDATYWLALVAYSRGNYNSAEDYLSKRILEKMPNSFWRHGALYNLARTAEASSQIDRAAMIYQSDSDAPDIHGRQLRASWLQEKTDTAEKPVEKTEN